MWLGFLVALAVVSVLVVSDMVLLLRVSRPPHAAFPGGAPLTGDKRILEAFRSAVNETMQEIESEMQTRVRRNGKDSDRETGSAVWAEFIHSTSRPVEGVPD